MIDILLIITLLVTTIVLIISWINILSQPYLYRSAQTKGDLTIVIPARNEESNIKKCLQSIRKYDKTAPIIVVNDNSTDKTLEILQHFKDNHLKIINAPKLPKGWYGKHHACHIGAQEVTTKQILFLDADIVCTGKLTNHISGALKSNDAVSCFPQQKFNIKQYVVTPVMDWFLLSLLPFLMIRARTWSCFSAANGQCLAFNTKTYKQIGGHAAIKDQQVDDMAFARLLKKKKYKLQVFVGKRVIACYMFSSIKEAFRGLSRSFYKGSGLPAILFIPFVTILCLSLLISLLNPVSLLLLLITKYGLSTVTGQRSILNTVLLPIHIVMLWVLAVHSVLIKTPWKQRNT